MEMCLDSKEGLGTVPDSFYNERTPAAPGMQSSCKRVQGTFFPSTLLSENDWGEQLPPQH